VWFTWFLTVALSADPIVSSSFGHHLVVRQTLGDLGEAPVRISPERRTPFGIDDDPQLWGTTETHALVFLRGGDRGGLFALAHDGSDRDEPKLIAHGRRFGDLVVDGDRLFWSDLRHLYMGRIGEEGATLLATLPEGHRVRDPKVAGEWIAFQSEPPGTHSSNQWYPVILRIGASAQRFPDPGMTQYLAPDGTLVVASAGQLMVSHEGGPTTALDAYGQVHFADATQIIVSAQGSVSRWDGATWSEMHPCVLKLRSITSGGRITGVENCGGAGRVVSIPIQSGHTEILGEADQVLAVTRHGVVASRDKKHVLWMQPGAAPKTLHDAGWVVGVNDQWVLVQPDGSRERTGYRLPDLSPFPLAAKGRGDRIGPAGRVILVGDSVVYVDFERLARFERAGEPITPWLVGPIGRASVQADTIQFERDDSWWTVGVGGGPIQAAEPPKPLKPERPDAREFRAYQAHTYDGVHSTATREVVTLPGTECTLAEIVITDERTTPVLGWAPTSEDCAGRPGIPEAPHRVQERSLKRLPSGVVLIGTSWAYTPSGPVELPPCAAGKLQNLFDVATDGRSVALAPLNPEKWALRVPDGGRHIRICTADGIETLPGKTEEEHHWVGFVD
jgi:hypothetical protein